MLDWRCFVDFFFNFHCCKFLCSLAKYEYFTLGWIQIWKRILTKGPTLPYSPPLPKSTTFQKVFTIKWKLLLVFLWINIDLWKKIANIRPGEITGKTFVLNIIDPEDISSTNPFEISMPFKRFPPLGNLKGKASLRPSCPPFKPKLEDPILNCSQWVAAGGEIFRFVKYSTTAKGQQQRTSSECSFMPIDQSLQLWPIYHGLNDFLEIQQDGFLKPQLTRAASRAPLWIFLIKSQPSGFSWQLTGIDT